MERWTISEPSDGRYRPHISHGGTPFWCMFDFVVLPAPGGCGGVDIELAVDVDPVSGDWFPHLRCGMLRGLAATRAQGREWFGVRVEIRKVHVHPTDTTVRGCEWYGFSFAVDDLPLRGVKLPLQLLRRGQPMNLVYALEPQLTPAEFIDLLVRSTLAERRPVHEADTVAAMLANASLIVTARSNGRLVGVSRAMTDFAYCTYLSDLAVDVAHQRQGIGRELIRRTHEAAGLGTTLILLAAPAARAYYPHIGMQPHDSCWIIPRQPQPGATP